MMMFVADIQNTLLPLDKRVFSVFVWRAAGPKAAQGKLFGFLLRGGC